VNVAAMPASALRKTWAQGALLPEKPPVLTVVAAATVGTAPAARAQAPAHLRQPLIISRAEAEGGSGAGVDMTVTGTISITAAEAELPNQPARR
jgi:hypothetical protein